MRVTFDTNVLADVLLSTEQSPAGRTVRTALIDGRIKGFISEAVIALDVFDRPRKAEMVGRGQIVAQSRTTGPLAIELSVGPRWTRPALHPKSAERINAAFSIGMKVLIGPRRFDDLLPGPELRDHYEDYPSHDAFLAGSTKTNDVDRELARRSLGRARAVGLGLDFSAKAGANGEWWPQGLGRANTKAERKKVYKAISEWADGDAIAAHIGYGNDLFCTLDLGGNAGRQSVLHQTNRAWLQKQYGLRFVTLAELASSLSPA